MLPGNHESRKIAETTQGWEKREIGRPGEGSSIEKTKTFPPLRRGKRPKRKSRAWTGAREGSQDARHEEEKKRPVHPLLVNYAAIKHVPVFGTRKERPRK